eukprot:1682798-Pyramimonas_sp.AAC.1
MALSVPCPPRSGARKHGLAIRGFGARSPNPWIGSDALPEMGAGAALADEAPLGGYYAGEGLGISGIKPDF